MYRSPIPQVKGLALLLARLSAAMDDPPRYDERNAMAWLVCFMTYVASNNAAAVTETAELSRGGVIFDHTDPNLRRKMAKRLGMTQHPEDAEVVQEAVAKAAAALAEAGKEESAEKQ